MSKENISVIVEGGNAKPGAQLGGTLGPLGINIGKVVSEINNKTKSFDGMKVPVKITVDTDTKDFDIRIGSPPITELIKKELGLENGSSIPHLDFVGNISIEQLVKLARMKMDNMNSYEIKNAVKEISGSCKGMGVLCEGMDAKVFNQKLEAGEYDDVLSKESPELSDEKKKKLEEQLESKRKETKKELDALIAKKEKEAAAKMKKTGVKGLGKETEEAAEGMAEGMAEGIKEGAGKGKTSEQAEAKAEAIEEK